MYHVNIIVMFYFKKRELWPIGNAAHYPAECVLHTLPSGNSGRSPAVLRR